MSGNLAKVGERTWNSSSQGNLIVIAQQLTYLYFIRTVIKFFIRDVRAEFGLIKCICSTYCLQFH